MVTSNSRKGAEAERMVARYLREQGFWLADRRLREGRQDDQGDLDGIPLTTVQVKYVAERRLQTWITATLKQRNLAGTPLCLLVHRIKQRRPEGWDAYMPGGLGQDEAEAWTWVRMDLRLAVVALKNAITTFQPLPSDPFSNTTESPSVERWERPYALFTENGKRPSPMTSIEASSSAMPATPRAPQST